MILTLVFGTMLSILASLSTLKWQQEKQAAHFTQESRELTGLLQGTMKQILTELQGVVSFITAFEEISQASFSQFAAPYFSYLHPSYNPSLHSLAWAPRVPGDQRGSFEATAQRDGLIGFHFTEKDPGGDLVPEPDRAEYFPVYRVLPFQGNDKGLGYDGLRPQPMAGIGIFSKQR